MKFVLGIILSIILLMSGLGYDVNYAEARGDDEPCSYTSPHSFLKISNDPWKCEKVDYWVPEKCGIKAGLYKTDTSCQPPPAPTAEPAPVPTKPAEPMSSPPSQSEFEQKKASIDAFCQANPGKCSDGSNSTVQKNRDSMFSGIMAAVVILIIIGIGILFARKKLHGSFGGGGSDGYDGDDYDDAEYYTRKAVSAYNKMEEDRHFRKEVERIDRQNNRIR